MANPLTGDFDAVLQVSGGTVNRLLASMHQNDGANPNVPTFAHSVTVNLGEHEVIDGVRGRLDAQVSTPVMELVDHAEDRFVLHVWIRAAYLPAYGSEPLADLINGEVRAEYRITAQADHLAFAVVEDSVSFAGTVDNEPDATGDKLPVDVPATIEKVNRQLRYLLTGLFAPVPHPVSARFGLGSMMSLAKGPGNTAVAVPLAPSGPQIGSIDQVVLGGHDFGVALSADYILGQVQPMLEDLRARFVQHIGFHAETHVDLGPLGSPTILTIDIGYTVTLTSASIEWTPNGFIVRISGQALTEKSEYNLTFDVTQTVLGGFDAASEGLWLGAGGAPVVTVHYGGPFSGDVINTATPAIQQQAAAQVQSLLRQAAAGFDLSSAKAELVQQLATMADGAKAHFEDARFSIDGVVLLGRIVLSPRRVPMGTFKKTPEGNAFTARDSWIPGGRIDSFAWAWRWMYGDASNPNPEGSHTEQITFKLSRPVVPSPVVGAPMDIVPVPGLDGNGTLYLSLVGEQVDPLNGELTPVRYSVSQVFSWQNHTPGSVTDPTEPPDPIDHHPHWASGKLSGEGFHPPGSNTLVVLVGERWRPETAAVLRDGLAACRRQDAGVAVIVLFDDGRLATGMLESGDALRQLATEIDAPMIMNEDVNGEWSKALLVPKPIEQPAWRLLSSTGGLTWMSDDAVTAEELGSALDDYLFPCGPPVAHPYSPIDPSFLVQATLRFTDPDSPSLPLRGHGSAGRALVFTTAGSTASDDRVAQLTNARSGEDAAIVVVVRGASADEASAYGAKFGKGVVAVPDPDGEITAAAGVRYWPTSLSVDETGVVTSVDLGVTRDAAGGGPSA